MTRKDAENSSSLALDTISTLLGYKGARQASKLGKTGAAQTKVNLAINKEL